MPRRDLPRHTRRYVCCRGNNVAVRWAPKAKKPVYPAAPACPVCGHEMTLRGKIYQPAAADTWDNQLERTQIILAELTERETN